MTRRTSPTRLRWALFGALGVGVVGCLLAVLVAWLNYRDDDAGAASPPPPAPTSAEAASQVQRGAYLAVAGNCAGCHTARGGAVYAGGRGIETPFGSVYASNLTPDAVTGLGRWAAGDFWRALHHGRSRDGRLLYPAFPYPNFTQVTREDADALFAYLRTVPPVAQPNLPHAVRFPYSAPAALAVWRALFFRPGVHTPRTDQSAAWNRGSYLVQGLGHCVACHAERNLLGATRHRDALDGGLIPVQNWYAPSLASDREAGVAPHEAASLVQLLKTGQSPQATVMGPMAEVVFLSTQYLTDDDLRAMATYLQGLPRRDNQPATRTAADPALLPSGAKVYDAQCAACHGTQGQGVPGAYPPLAGNRAVLLDEPVNVIHAIVQGGFPPATAGNPRPYGMPPFGGVLTDQDIAAVASHIRASWGNQAPPVRPAEVLRAR